MAKRKIILVIDDDKIQCGVVKARLGNKDGFKVETAYSGEAGLKIASKIIPDLILLDWVMPEMDGLQVLKELKSKSRTKEIIVFMFTAKNMMGDLEDAAEVGAEGYFTKPIDLSLLSTRVKETLA